MSETILAFEELVPEVHDVEAQPDPQQATELLERHQQIIANLARTCLQENKSQAE